ncbi:hypothetical protein J2Y37_002426 [Prolinoborus sp. 3657]|nr:hypothetical protein [Prolinoborus sp. 3657]
MQGIRIFRQSFLSALFGGDHKDATPANGIASYCFNLLEFVPVRYGLVRNNKHHPQPL